MACTQITAGRSLNCSKTIGGIESVFFVEYDGVSAFTASSTGLITGFTMNSGSAFYEYKCIQETSSMSFTPNANVQNQSLFYEELVTIVLAGYDATLRNQLITLSDNTVRAVVKTNEGKYIYLGERSGLDINGGEGGTGTAAGDRNGISFTFRGINEAPPREVSASIIVAPKFITV